MCLVLNVSRARDPEAWIPDPVSELKSSQRLKRAMVVEKRGMEVVVGCREEKETTVKTSAKVKRAKSKSRFRVCCGPRCHLIERTGNSPCPSKRRWFEVLGACLSFPSEDLELPSEDLELPTATVHLSRLPENSVITWQ